FLRVLSVCSGYGGLDLGISLALRGRSRAVAFVERDARAQAALLARMEEAALDPAPVFGDLSEFDGQRFRGSVDLVAAGIPCQGHSAAGSRQGASDGRNLWPDLRDILDDCHAPLLFLENVRGEPVRGGFLAGLLAELAALGFDAEWACLRAADVGAPHQRERFWLVAADRQRLREWRVPDAVCDALRLQPERGQGCPQAPDKWDAEPGVMGQDLWPPGPSDFDAWDRVPAEAQPAIRGRADGSSPRLDECDRFRLCGNGVVPLQAALAFRSLARRLLRMA
ncbi:unnamed protein product, partial [Scytosiphon promiscuus]